MTENVFDIGKFDGRYSAFIETMRGYRAKLHRYCSRMTGSVLDGEDVMQDVLFEAYRKLDLLQDGQSIGPWLFRIAHNRCIDFIRKRTVRQAKEAAAAEPDIVMPAEFHGHGIGGALEKLVINLPPRERACVLLKDVFDYSLEEIADLIDGTVGGVKSALHRGRAKLSALTATAPSGTAADAKLSHLYELYIERFNRQDWDGVRQLISEDARLLITDIYAGPAVTNYFTRFEAMPYPHRLMSAHLDGEPVLVLLGGLHPQMAPSAVVRLLVSQDRVAAISHYTGCPWILSTGTLELSLTPAHAYH